MLRLDLGHTFTLEESQVRIYNLSRLSNTHLGSILCIFPKDAEETCFPLIFFHLSRKAQPLSSRILSFCSLYLTEKTLYTFYNYNSNGFVPCNSRTHFIYAIKPPTPPLWPLSSSVCMSKDGYRTRVTAQKGFAFLSPAAFVVITST